MSVVERFKKRRAVSPVVEVTLSGEPPVTFKIARISQVELERATRDARKQLREEGLDLNDVSGLAFTLARMAAIGKLLQSHVKGWDLKEIPYSKEHVAEFFQEMDLDESTQLGLEYYKACEADSEEKKTACESFLQLFQKPLESASESSSAPNPNSSVGSVPVT
jgi:hypothetical protein